MARPKKNIAKRLIHHYRWMLVDDDTRESKISFRLNMLNTLIFIAIVTLLLVGLGYLVLKYSPLKSYFVEEKQAFNEVQSKKELLQINEKMVALEDSLQRNNLYIEHLQMVVSGKIKAMQVDSLMAKQTPTIIDEEKLQASTEDSLFRAQIAKEELESLQNNESEKTANILYPPVRGVITASYDLTENHLATDIAAQTGESVKTVADGIVLFSEWSPETGNSIIVSHDNEIISMYKHCSKVFKKVGDEVKKGDVIAAVGNTGELTTGPHLHFELWVQGKAVDAEQYIEF